MSPNNGHSHANSHKSSPKKRRRPLSAALTTDKALLHIFLASVVIVCISILLIPLTLDDSVDNSINQQLQQPQQLSHSEHHSVASQLQKSVTEAQNMRLKPSEQKPLEQSKPKDNENSGNKKKDYFKTNSSPYHVIMSSGCSTFQDWQSYVFFYHVLQSGQEGHVTRIASGCSSGEEEKSLHDIFADEIESMNPGKHHLHLTPDFSTVLKKVKKPFKYFNKPFGVRHWFEHALGYPDNHALHDDSVVILLDPDQILLRPFTRDFSHSSEVWRLKHEYKHKPIEERPQVKTQVEHGSPFSQQFGYGIQWLTKVDPDYVFQDMLPTPVANMTKKEARDYYFAMGPPYVATAKDMYAIVKTWSDIVPKVHDEYPYLLAE